MPVALAAIEELSGRVGPISDALARGLRRLHETRPEVVRGGRGRGLLWGLELSSAELAGKAIIALAQAGVPVSPCLSDPATARLLPPLVASDGEIAEALRILTETVAALPEGTG